MTQQYGTVKVDVITYTSGTGGSETDQSITVSSLATISRTGITVTGDINANNIYISGAAQVSGLATVSGLVVGQDATITGNLVVGSGIQASSLVVQDNATVSGELGVSGLATVSGLTVTNATNLNTLTATGATSLNTLTATGATNLNTLTATGDSNFDDVEVSGNLTVTGDATISGNLTVTGDTNISGDLTVQGDLNASGVTISGFTGLFASGTASAPSISFEDDKDTGIYNSDANELAFSTSGSAAAKFDSLGTLNIGNNVDGYENKATLSGEALLVVDKSMNAANTEAESELLATFGYGQAGNETRRLAIFAPGVGGGLTDPRAKIKTINTNYGLGFELGYSDNEKEVIRLNSNGTVGINQNAPRKKVEIQGNGSSTVSGAGVLITSTGQGIENYTPDGPGLFLTAQGMNTNSKYTPILAFGSTDQDFTSNNPRTGASIVGVAAETFSNNDRGAMHMAFFTRPRDAGSSQVQTEAMIIRQDQKVGIGISNPSTKLEVQMSGQIDPAVVSATSPKGTINTTLQSGTRGLDEIGPGYSFGGINTSRRKALITSTQTTANDTYGLSFYTALNNDINSDVVAERVRIDHQGFTGFNITNPQDYVHTPSATIPSGLALSTTQQDRRYSCSFAPQSYVSGEQILVLATIVFAGNSQNITLNGTCGSNAGTIHGTSEFNIQLRNNNADTPVIVIGTQEYKHENIRPSIKAYKNITSGNTNEFVLAMSADINGRNTIHAYYASFTAQLRDAAYQPYITMPDSVIDLTPNLANYQETIIPVNTTAIVETITPSTSGSRGLSNYGIGTIDPQAKLHVASGNIRVDSGYGVNFADYGSGVSISSNVLDDYEKGYFTPGISGITAYTVASGQYTKIGNCVNFTCRVDGSAATPGATILQITGLPFQSAGTSAVSYGGAYRSFGILVDDTINTNMNLHIPLNSTAIRFYTANSTIDETDAGVILTQNIIVHGQYFTT